MRILVIHAVRSESPLSALYASVAVPAALETTIKERHKEGIPNTEKPHFTFLFKKPFSATFLSPNASAIMDAAVSADTGFRSSASA